MPQVDLLFFSLMAALCGLFFWVFYLIGFRYFIKLLEVILLWKNISNYPFLLFIFELFFFSNLVQKLIYKSKQY